MIVLAPAIDQAKGDFRGLFEKLQRQGFVRVRLDGEIHELDEKLKATRTEAHSIEIVVDRLVVREGVRTRLMEAIETALKWHAREVRFLLVGEGVDEVRSYTTRYANPRTGLILEEFTPRHFSFNTHVGACPTCEGVGTVMAGDPKLIVPDETKSIKDGAVHTWFTRQPRLRQLQQQGIEGLAKHFNAPLDRPFRELPEEFKKALFHGTGKVAVPTGWKIDANKRSVAKPFEGLLPQLTRFHGQSNSANLRASLARFMNALTCPTCKGKRLRPEVLSVKLKGESGRGIVPLSKSPQRGQDAPATLGKASEINIHEYTTFSVREAIAWTRGLVLTDLQKAYCTDLQREILKRLEFLDQVGLGYLTLDRESGTLSGGEAQRIRLAAQIGSGLAGVLYVLDEPSIGLHPVDNTRLIATLKHLRDLGNSVLVVEHDEETMQAADWLVELGPGAGPQGGRITAQGVPGDFVKDEASLTAAYLSGRLRIAVPRQRVPPHAEQIDLLPGGPVSPEDLKPAKRLTKAEVTRQKAAARFAPPRPSTSDAAWLTVHHATEHNLRNVTASFPLGCFVCVTGPSGSGKSSLVDAVLRRALMRHFYRAKDEPGAHERISGMQAIDKVVVIDQSPIGRSPRSNPATYTGAFTPIRELFAHLPAAKVRGYDAGRFSFNIPGGRCEKCGGDGVLTIDMQFLADVQVTCDQCNGKRYNAETLEIAFKGRNISEVLDMTISEGCRFFDRQPNILPKLRALEDVGLGYVKLGQSGSSLSGGEAQRVKLAAELAKIATGRTLYLLDEPTTGLHFADIQKLLDVLLRLRDAGNTLVVIEHNLDVIKCADWVIDLGPSGGSGGGEIVAVGTPEQVAKNPKSATGKFLVGMLNG